MSTSWGGDTYPNERSMSYLFLSVLETVQNSDHCAFARDIEIVRFFFFFFRLYILHTTVFANVLYTNETEITDYTWL